MFLTLDAPPLSSNHQSPTPFIPSHNSQKPYSHPPPSSPLPLYNHSSPFTLSIPPLPSSMKSILYEEIPTESIFGEKRMLQSPTLFWESILISWITGFVQYCQPVGILCVLLSTSWYCVCIVFNQLHLFVYCCQPVAIVCVLLSTSWYCFCIADNSLILCVYCWQPIAVLCVLLTTMQLQCVLNSMLKNERTYEVVDSKIPYTFALPTLICSHLNSWISWPTKFKNTIGFWYLRIIMML